MSMTRRLFSWARVSVVTWASAWMLAVPLFHVHPEADHRHGEAGHIHGGTVHTVWSPDLDGEFQGHQSVGRADPSTPDGISHHRQFSRVPDRPSEFGFSVLYDSTDRKSLKPFLIQALGYSPAMTWEPEPCGWGSPNIISVLPSASFIHSISFRGPPHRFA